MLMRAATVVQVLQDLNFIACFISLVIAPLNARNTFCETRYLSYCRIEGNLVK